MEELQPHASAWSPASVAGFGADALAIAGGRALGRNLPEKVIKVGAAVLFFVFGAWLVVEALAQLVGATVGHPLLWVALGPVVLALGLSVFGLWRSRRTGAAARTPDGVPQRSSSS